MASFAIIILAIIILAAVILLGVLYLKNLQDTLRECAPKNRLVPPSNVWLMFIPLFNLIYPFILYPKISGTLKLEFADRNAVQQGDYGKGIGTAMAVLGLCGMIPVIGGFIGIASLVLFIIFWSKMASFKTLLQRLPKTNEMNSGMASTDLLDA